jgi:predicted protein tyrosine phosphatase
MHILIKSRAEIEEMAQNPFTKPTAIISITDAGWTFAELENKPHHLLQLAFDDVDNDIFEDEFDGLFTQEKRLGIEQKYNMLSDEQAKQIAEFYAAIKDSVHNLICQCEHGQSRSAAVAAAITQYEHNDGIKIFANDKYYPNKAVFKKVLKQLDGGM